MPTHRCHITFYRPMPSDETGLPAIYHPYAIWASPHPQDAGWTIASILPGTHDSPDPPNIHVLVQDSDPNAALAEARRQLCLLPGNQDLQILTDCPTS